MRQNTSFYHKISKTFLRSGRSPRFQTLSMVGSGTLPHTLSLKCFLHPDRGFVRHCLGRTGTYLVIYVLTCMGLFSMLLLAVIAIRSLWDVHFSRK